ncbi:MAG: hypothetical protein O2883_09405, partial [Proteobacteria bacterium]|nr:hypothetical protein [Pseudomonadota bacterium]
KLASDVVYIFRFFYLILIQCETYKNSMNRHFSKFFLHWFGLIFLAYLGLIAVQQLVMMPIETMMVERNVALVSFLYLPPCGKGVGGVDGWA